MPNYTSNTYTPPTGSRFTFDQFLAEATKKAEIEAKRAGERSVFSGELSPLMVQYLKNIYYNELTGPALQKAFEVYGSIWGDKPGQIEGDPSGGAIRPSQGDDAYAPPVVDWDDFRMSTPEGTAVLGTGYDYQKGEYTPEGLNIYDQEASIKEARTTQAINVASSIAAWAGVGAASGAFSAAAPAAAETTAGTMVASDAPAYTGGGGALSPFSSVGGGEFGTALEATTPAIVGAPAAAETTPGAMVTPDAAPAPPAGTPSPLPTAWWQNPIVAQTGVGLAGTAIEALTPKDEPPEAPEYDTSYTIKDMSPLDQEVTKIAGEQWDRYVTKFRPYENKVMWDVANTERFLPQQLGAINADLTQKQTSLRNYATIGGGRTGALLSPETSGAGNYAATLARANVAGVQGNAAEKASAMGNLVTMGRGGGTMAATGVGNVASNAAQGAINTLRTNTAADTFNADVRTQDSLNQNAYLTSLFSSGAGVTMYGADKGWFK